VPGATKAGEPPELGRIRQTIEQELSLIEPEDDADRNAAAVRLQKLAQVYQFWGKPALIDVESRSGMRA
jgi:hypothetical protein